MRATSSVTGDAEALYQPETRHMDMQRQETKRRRLVQIGSSPPPLTTALQRGIKRINRDHATLTSPKPMRKRRAVTVPVKNPLELRSSSPASPPLAKAPLLARASATRATAQSTAPQQRHSRTRSDAGGVRDQLQRTRQLETSNGSSPIGTFGAYNVGRSDRTTKPSRFGPVGAASANHSSKRTVGLPTLNEAVRTRSNLRSTTRAATVESNENANAQPIQAQAQRTAKSSKAITEEKLTKQTRRRPKIHRVQLGTTIPACSPTEQPLGDADHQLNSQPEEADYRQYDRADESEISYFPTLPPARLSSSGERHVPNSKDAPVTSNVSPLYLTIVEG